MTPRVNLALGALILAIGLASGCGGRTFTSDDDGQDGGAIDSGASTGGRGGDGGAGGRGGDGGVSTGGVPPGTGGAAGEPCGPAYCGPGEYCCNESCGICAAVGAGCPAIACVDPGPTPCGPAVCGVGEQCCDSFCGSCGPIGEPCQPVDCPVETCGPNVCGPGEYCCDPSCGTCAPIGAACTGGCSVDAGSAGVRCGRPWCAPGQVCCDAICGVCASTQQECMLIDYICAPECAPQDARGIGACQAFFGYRWNGYDCEGLGGCSCEGTECASLFSTLEECLTAHGGCPIAVPSTP